MPELNDRQHEELCARARYLLFAQQGTWEARLINNYIIRGLRARIPDAALLQSCMDFSNGPESPFARPWAEKQIDQR